MPEMRSIFAYATPFGVYVCVGAANSNATILVTCLAFVQHNSAFFGVKLEPVPLQKDM